MSVMDELIEEIFKSKGANLISLHEDGENNRIHKGVYLNILGEYKFDIMDSKGNTLYHIDKSSYIIKIDYDKHYTMFLIDNKYLLMIIAKE